MAKESEVLGGVQATLTNANPAALLQHAALPDLNKEEIARYSRHLKCLANAVSRVEVAP